MRYILASLLLASTSHAAVIGVAENSAGVILLHNEAGICSGNALQAEWVPHSGPRVLGCWIAGGPTINAVFLDGDIARIPAQMVREPKAV